MRMRSAPSKWIARRQLPRGLAGAAMAVVPLAATGRLALAAETSPTTAADSSTARAVSTSVGE